MSTLFQQLKVVSISDTHNIEEFDCGDAARSTWLRERALSSSGKDNARTYVVADKDARVFGFYAVTVGSIIRGSLPGSLRRNAPDPVSCILLAQLGVDLSYQGQGVGRDLVMHAMTQAEKIAEIVGCRLFAVHPDRPDLVPYYKRFEFLEVATNPALMAMSMAKVRGILKACQGR